MEDIAKYYKPVEFHSSRQAANKTKVMFMRTFTESLHVIMFENSKYYSTTFSKIALESF